MRLTADILLRAESYLNAYRDRELYLRGLKIPAIENLSVLQDQFDIIDFSDNDIKKLDNFPPMRRLSALLFHNNYISRINESVGTALSSLNTLILTNNRIVSLAEIDNIAKLKQLQVLSLLDNPVISRPNYRLYTIFKIPTLKVLDFQKVKKKEREEASAFFASDVGKAYMTAIAQESRNNNSNGTRPVMMLTDEQKALVKAAIEAATTKDDIDRIEKQLKEGTFPFPNTSSNGVDNSASMDI